MLSQEIMDILSKSKEWGWVLEPDAKRLLALAGLDVPQFIWANRLEEGVGFAEEIGYPVVAKAVSPKVIHKTEAGGVALGIDSKIALAEAFHRFSDMDGFQGVLVEETMSGAEMIIGSKIDYQFGPVILLGIGGTGVEIYKDTTLRMAPIGPKDVTSMLKSLKAHKLLEGYRGAEPVSLEALTRTLTAFSSLIVNLGEAVTSIDLNPVFCSATRCVVGDARFMLE
ncbi:MAG: acetate--CoA ligase family protein [Proteobacteria bacterium]|nr:acetate--CoA ligase family protein [Pseudomonadota bacterium]MBU1903145.1 acetate--CoA ligase family protein [Pseudomonadota bacterium]